MSTYPRDSIYTADYMPELHPHRLHLAALLHGHSPGFDPDRPKYLELGCGNGLTLALLAAALPYGDFVGVDFNPSHIARARTLAAEAGLDNVRFLCGDFAEAQAWLAGDSYDIIAAHGVYSWIEESPRRSMERLVGCCLRVGGLLQVSYNARPAWSAPEPAQKLMCELIGQRSDAGLAALERALDQFDRLSACEAGWFDPDSGAIPGPFRDPQRRTPGWKRYAVHEYGLRCWHAWYHCDVRRHMEDSLTLTYVGTTDYARVWADTGGTSALEPALAAIDEPALRETLRDYVVQPALRDEIYTRGWVELSTRQRCAAIDGCRVALRKVAEDVGPEVDVPLGKVPLDEERVAALTRRLHVYARDSIGQLLQVMTDNGAEDSGVSRRAVVLLARAGVLHPVPSDQAMAGPERVRRFNAAVAQWARSAAPYSAFLSGVSASGIGVAVLPQLVWQALEHFDEADAQHIAARLYRDWGVRVERSEDTQPAGEEENVRRAVADALSQDIPRIRRLVGAPSPATLEDNGIGSA